MNDADHSRKPITRIVVCGKGLAAHMTAAMLSNNLPESIQIVSVACPDLTDDDSILGNLAPPSAYGFNLSAEVQEPNLLVNTSTAFSWGTKFEAWGVARRSWVQCFHLPLPIMGGVLFHHYLARMGISDLQPYLISAMAALKGKFAHPHAKNDSKLTRAEYGYLFEPLSYSKPFAAIASARKVKLIAANISSVEHNGDAITGLRLSDGQSLTADLYVDCTGLQAALISCLGAIVANNRSIRVLSSIRPNNAELGPPCRKLTGHSFGWQVESPLRGATARLTICSTDSEQDAVAAHGTAPQIAYDVMLGRRSHAWKGNCVAIGPTAGCIEPLTHAPMLLLQRDIERLASLVPCSDDMTMECREFNRQHADDYLHAELFHRALFAGEAGYTNSYWTASNNDPMHEKLTQKLSLFQSHGQLVSYDLEPFNPEDWIIMHYGMGRLPARYDRVADRPPEAEIRQYLAGMRGDIERVVMSMPSHHEYVQGIARYLKQKAW